MIEEFKVYIVNLKTDKNRKKNIIKELVKQNIKNYEIIDAIDGNKLNKNKLNLVTFKDKNHLNPWNSKLSPSQIGCALSHIKIYKKFIETKFNFALIKFRVKEFEFNKEFKCGEANIEILKPNWLN